MFTGVMLLAIGAVAVCLFGVASKAPHPSDAWHPTDEDCLCSNCNSTRTPTDVSAIYSLCATCYEDAVLETRRRIHYCRDVVTQILMNQDKIDVNKAWITAKELVESDPTRRSDLDPWVRW